MSTQTSSPLESRMPLSVGANFRRFPELPYELRHAIWKLCKPHRVCDMDRIAWAIDEDKATSCSGVGVTSLLNSGPPVITQVCQESRAVFLERYEAQNGNVVQEKEKGLAPESQDFVYYADIKWFNPGTDIIHLNWNPTLEYNMWNNYGNPITQFLRLAATCQGASLTADLVHPYDIRPGGYPTYNHFLYTEYKPHFYNPNLELLSFRKDLLITLQVVCLHVSVEAALNSGLFGRLGEERIVLVPTADSETISKYHRLWEAGPEDREAGEFFDTMKLLQGNVVKWQYELVVYWLRFKCEQALKDGFASNSDLNGIWLADDHNDEEDYDSDNGMIRYSKGPGANWSGFFDEHHPFVKDVLEKMPNFEPVIMFRLCELECYENYELKES